MSNLGRAVAGMEPAYEDRKTVFAHGERLMSALSKMDKPLSTFVASPSTTRPVLRSQETVTPDDFEIKYDATTADWGTV